MERTAFSIDSGSVKIRKYSNYSVQLRFALCDFEKYGSGLVKVRQKFRKPVYKIPVRLRFYSLIKTSKNEACFALSFISHTENIPILQLTFNTKR